MRLIGLFILLLAIGAASYWYASNYEQRRLRPVPVQKETTTLVEPATPAATQDKPYREHVVVAGETLYSISKQYGLQWSSVAEYNGISDSTVLRTGTVLKIPLNAKGEVTRIQAVPKPSDADIQTITQSLLQGKDTWYADPVQVVRKTAPSEYHLKNDDRYTIISLDYPSATAIIEVIHDDRTISISLSQFTPGKGNAWYITQIETQ